jgi:hypothetical protein
MRRCWGWTLAWIALLCLLWSLSLQACDQYQSSCEWKPAVTWQRESRSLSSNQDAGILSRTSVRSRAGPQEFSFTPDVFSCVEDLDPVGPPWLEYRGPPGKYRGPARTVRPPAAMIATAARIQRVKYAFNPNFPGGCWPELKYGVFQQPLISVPHLFEG